MPPTVGDSAHPPLLTTTAAAAARPVISGAYVTSLHVPAVVDVRDIMARATYENS